MKKFIILQAFLIVILFFCFMIFNQFFRNKEVVRQRFSEWQIRVNNLHSQSNQSFSGNNDLTYNSLRDSSYRRENDEGRWWLFFYEMYFWLLAYSSDFYAFIQTGMHNDKENVYDIWDLNDISYFMRNMKYLYYIYSISSIQRKGRNQYDLCIEGAVSYSSVEKEEFSHWPFRIDRCIPIVFKNDKIFLRMVVWIPVKGTPLKNRLSF